MILFFCFILISNIWCGECFNNIPLAPYHLKLYCRNGQSSKPETRVLSLCPLSSTSCGYFEFEKILLPGEKEEGPLGIYGCIDSSILLDNDANEEIQQSLFSKYCDDQARCQEITLTSLNPRFVQYLINQSNSTNFIRREDSVDKSQWMSRKRIKFCCAINDHPLQKVIHSDDYILPRLVPSIPIVCHNVHCHGMPVGCLSYSEYNRTEESEEDEVVVRPVHINFDNHAFTDIKNRAKLTTKYHCVYRHFNDELYRYCLLINDQQPSDNNNHCFYGDNYQICCCFLHRGAQTCDPLLSEKATITEVPEILPHNPTTFLPIYNSQTKTKIRIRCRTASDILPKEDEISINVNGGKKFLCEAHAISISHKICSYNVLLMICYFMSNLL